MYLSTLIHLPFFLIVCCRFTSCQYDQKNIVAGSKFSANEHILISASNAYSNFAVVLHPFRNASVDGPKRCNMRYNTTDRFVHSVAAVGPAKNGTDPDAFTFVFAAETMSTMTSYVCVATISKLTCISRSLCTQVSPPGSPQQYFLLDVDTIDTFAYGFTTSFAFKLKLDTNEMVLNLTTDVVWPSLGFSPRAMDVTDSWAVVVGYGYMVIGKKDYGDLACLVPLSSLVGSSCVLLVSETTFIVPADILSYNDLYEMSVAIRGQKVLVGIHRLESIITLQNAGASFNITGTHTVPYSESSSFGRAVGWADDTTMVVMVYKSFLTSWSKSQVFVFNESLVSAVSAFYTFPNHQQILGTRLGYPYFARMVVTAEGNMALLTSLADILIIPRASVGYTSVWIETSALTFVFYYVPRVCIGGTYKNVASLGPCQICPPRTRNPGTLSSEVSVCLPCSSSSSTSFCPLASLIEIDSTTVNSYTQDLAYPETADITEIDDLLLINMFRLQSEPIHCLVISPVFWTLITGVLSFLVWLLMFALKKCKSNRCRGCRKTAKAIFKHTDVIGEGELWIGGLGTLAVLVLISFSYWFAASFIQRYPIEEIVEPAAFSCDPSLVNAKFSSGLDLLSLPKSTDAQPIFNLLDAQVFRLTVELVNSGFSCNSITAQQNLVGTNYVTLSIQCTRSASDAITSVTFPLPNHYTTVQINMTGPHWIGGIRLCIRGDGQTLASSTLQQLDFCQFYSSANQAIGRTTIVPIVFIKNINITKGLSASDATLYSGLWMPTFGSVSLSDEPYYAEFGNYLRYTSSMTIIQVELDERPFYVKNNQEPIVRTAQMIFHALLFTSLCIELFAFVFLLTKLCFVPLSQKVGLLCRKCPCKHQKPKSATHTEQTSLDLNHFDNDVFTSPAELQEDIALKYQPSVRDHIPQDEESSRCSSPETVSKL